MDKKPYKAKKCRPPDLDKFIKPEWKQAKAVYKINGVKLINIEKIERFIEAFEEVED